MLYICSKIDENKIKIMHSIPLRIDYDSNWKIITTNLIEDFIEFFCLISTKM